MALPKKLLSRDEVVVRHMHTHPKVLLWRILLEILLLAVSLPTMRSSTQPSSLVGMRS